MYARACRLAVAALPLLLGACAGVAPRPDVGAGDAHAGAGPAATLAADAHVPATGRPVVPRRAFDVPPPELDPAWFGTPLDPLGEDADRLIGRVSWYGKRFAGRRTASGERFDPRAMTMAHRELPFGTRVRVINPGNGRSVVVRVNDRGPFVGARIADLSHAAARQLGMLHDGVIVAHLEVLDDAPAPGDAAARAAAEPRGAGGPTELASAK